MTCYILAAIYEPPTPDTTAQFQSCRFTLISSRSASFSTLFLTSCMPQLSYFKYCHLTASQIDPGLQSQPSSSQQPSSPDSYGAASSPVKPSSTPSSPNPSSSTRSATLSVRNAPLKKHGRLVDKAKQAAAKAGHRARQKGSAEGRACSASDPSDCETDSDEFGTVQNAFLGAHPWTGQSQIQHIAFTKSS